MTVEVLPLGTKCSLQCRHCYQAPIREAGHPPSDYDMEAMKRALAEQNHCFTVFGGEPLLMPIEDLEELWRWGYEKYGQNSVQTSATTVTERHFELFRKYNVSVGISIDGPGELNDIRWAGAEGATRKATDHALAVLRKLLEENRSVSIITTLHGANASSERLPRLLDWYRDLDERGLRHVNLHLLEIDREHLRRQWGLSSQENVAALLACSELQADLKVLRFQPITDMVGLLRGEDGSTMCIWNGCDPYTTGAVHAIDGCGVVHNCSRANKAGVDMEKGQRAMSIRPLALYHTAQERGGCAGCRFWFACGGSCPGEAVNGDWRNKTEHCETLQVVFTALEKKLASLGLAPISLDSERRQAKEKLMLETFAASIRSGQPVHTNRPHGDHLDAERPVRTHGDHTDRAA